MSQGQPSCRIIAAILAGGKARRMGGFVKGMIEVAPGVPIVQRLIRQFSLAGIEEVVIVTCDPGPYLPYGRQIIPDLRPGMGPLGGIEAAIQHLAGRCDACCFLPCDLPGIGARELRALCDAFDPAADRVVYAQTGVFFDHPLCSVVHNALLPEISQALDRGERAVGRIWRRLGARAVHFDNDAAFLNVNTPEDLNGWRANRNSE